MNQITDYPETIIDIFSVNELKEHILDVNLILGAGISLSELMEILNEFSTKNDEFKYLKVLQEHLDLVAHIPVRNVSIVNVIAYNFFH